MITRKKMGRKTIAVAVAMALALPGVALAQDYQFEGGLSYLHIDPDSGSSDWAIGADLTWHLERVQTSGLPLAAAAFYNRNSSVSASYLTFDDLDLNLLNVGTELYYERFYIAADYVRFDNGVTSNDFVLGLGYVPVDGLRLAARYLIADEGDDAWAVDFKYLRPLAGDTAVGLDASAEFFDDFADTMVLSFSGDYYFNHAFSLGARIVYTDDDFDSDTAWGVGASYFITPTVSVQIEYLNSDLGDSSAARIAARF